MTIKELLMKPLAERREIIGSATITKFKIDEEEFRGYKGFSFFWEKQYVKPPKRSNGGRIDLSSHAWFLTPHLIINFALISLVDYRRIQNLLLFKNEFNVSFYDPIFNKDIIEPMYFAPEQQPAYISAQRALKGEKWTEILGVKDFIVELIGTNNKDQLLTVQYNLNKPADAVWTGNTVAVERDIYKNVSIGVGDSAFLRITPDVNNDTQKISDITFEDKYRFQYWTEKPDGSGFKYLDGDQYMIRSNLDLYANWKASV